MLSMRIFDFYLFKNLSVASVFITLTLITVIFLTQSLRFLELVIDSGASGFSFWVLTMLALPRFVEFILPLSFMAAILFTYNRMMMDSELIVIRASGASPMTLARPAIILGLIAAAFVMMMTTWLAPASLNQMQKMQNIIKAQFSSALFREQVFNRAGSGLTFYIHERDDAGNLKGIVIHDTRMKNEPPSTIVAERGTVSLNDDAYRIIVYDGSRQQFNKAANTLQRLNFERYTIDIPSSDNVQTRWREPDERGFFELFNPDITNIRDREHQREFLVEVHKRLTSPFLNLAFGLIAVAVLILGPVDRRGQTKRIAIAILACIVIQALYLAGFNIARRHDLGLVLMYALVLLPSFFLLFMLSQNGEKLRAKLLRGGRTKTANTKESA